MPCVVNRPLQDLGPGAQEGNEVELKSRNLCDSHSSHHWSQGWWDLGSKSHIRENWEEAEVDFNHPLDFSPCLLWAFWSLVWMAIFSITAEKFTMAQHLLDSPGTWTTCSGKELVECLWMRPQHLALLGLASPPTGKWSLHGINQVPNADGDT